MGKEGELWDDSALINAFDGAMSKYKKMHSKKKNNDSSSNGEKVINDDVSAHDEAIRRLDEAEEDNNMVSNTETHMTEAKYVAPVKENPYVDSHALKPYVDSSNGIAVQDAPKWYSQGSEDYNLLLSQYYELEEKKQQILQQLHQFDSWNYQCSGEGTISTAQWGTWSTSQEHPLPASQASHQTAVCSCCPCYGQCTVVPCTTYPCSLCGTCNGRTCTEPNAAMGSGKSPSLVDNDIVKTAMGAVEKAISSMKIETSVNSDINEALEKKKEEEGEMAQSICSETDLTAVFNAWYSAGFYTGKYLTEQSIAKKRHG